MYIYAFSQKLREKKRAYDINKMSKTFKKTISRLRFSKLSLSPVSDQNYFRPTRALIYDYRLRAISSKVVHILPLYVPILAVPILSFSWRSIFFVLIRQSFVLLALGSQRPIPVLGSTIVAHVAKSHNYVKRRK